MKKEKENICKFVTDTPNSTLLTVNFVFEKKNSNNEKILVKPVHTVYLTVGGEGKLLVDGKVIKLLPGTLVFVFSGEEHKIYGLDGFEYMYISFKGTRADELFQRYAVNTSNRIFCGLESLLPFWQNAVGKADDTNLDLVSECVVLYTFSQMSEVKSGSEQQLTSRIINHIENYFSDSKISLASVAKELGYSSKYISRIFSKNVGMTFSEYLTNTRIKQSVFLMENGVYTVKNVALLSGYTDPMYFSNVFKANLGVSPSEYLARLKETAEMSESEGKPTVD